MHNDQKSRFIPSFSKLFPEFPIWTFLKCPKSISLFTFGKKWLTEKRPEIIMQLRKPNMVTKK
jgi:hypothetical protein